MKSDDEKYFEPMSKKLIEFYGEGGPMQNKNARSYKMHPANLRAVGADKVMIINNNLL